MTYNEKSNFITFKDYRISRMEFKINNNYKGHQEEESITPIKIKREVAFHNNENKFIISLSCIIGDDVENKNNDHPFFLFVKMDGFFEYNVEAEQRQFLEKSFIHKNGPAILFPYLRSAITNIINTAGLKPIILPLINFSNTN